jgi:hypothetical protein
LKSVDHFCVIEHTHLTKGGRRFVRALHIKKIESATPPKLNGKIPCKIRKFFICSIFLSTWIRADATRLVNRFSTDFGAEQ